MSDQDKQPVPPSDSAPPKPAPAGTEDPAAADEVGGPKGPEPTRYGDWQIKGRVSDF